MKVVVAGYPKTGTKTLKDALEILGYNVYDFAENSIILQRDWAKILNEGWNTEDFKRMYNDVDAVTDAPACHFWEEIHKAFPESKIILMTRDEEKWFKSFQNQVRVGQTNLMFVLMQFLSPTFRKAMNTVSTVNGLVMFGIDLRNPWTTYFRPTTLNKELQKLKFRAHNAYVMQNAPSDKLLVYNLSQGWKPLCDFLGVPIPDENFPHKNKGGEIVAEALAKDPIIKRMKREVMVSMSLIAAGSIVAGYYLFKIGPIKVMQCGFDYIANLCIHPK